MNVCDKVKEWLWHWEDQRLQKAYKAKRAQIRAHDLKRNEQREAEARERAQAAQSKPFDRMIWTPVKRPDDGQS